MQYTKIFGIDKEVSRVALGTWAIGGWMWGGTDEDLSVRTIHAALDKGINVIDTAPVYGFGRSEKIVGKALKEYGGREGIVLATKAGLEWNEDKIRRNSSRERIRKEIEDSLQRLKTDYLDLYQIHWPDSRVPFEDTAGELEKLKAEGKIRAAGVSNFSPEQMEAFLKGGELVSNQPPYNLFERSIEEDVLPYCQKKGIALFTYGALCRGLLSGGMKRDRRFEGDDLRRIDPKFQEPRFESYLKAVEHLDEYAREAFGKRILHLAVRWILDQGIDVALWGARQPEQIDPLPAIMDFCLSDDDKKKVDWILQEWITDPVGPEFMAPPL
ncbi:MAG: aldo/keto reductase [Thermodesulfobacteriota bacterium]